MPRVSRTSVLIAAMVLLVTLMHYNTAMHIHAAHGIYRRLYYFPIIIAAFRGGTRAGWWTAVVICLLYIPHAFGFIGFDPAPTLEKVLEMTLYLAVGLVTGVLADRDRVTQNRLRRSLDEREHLEQELVRRERLAAVGRLSAGLAHEIRNPLASIKGASELLQDDIAPDGPRGRMLQIIKEEATRLNDVLTRFLAFARPVQRDRSPLDLGVELDRLGDLLAHRPQAPRVRLDVPDGPHTIEGDWTRIRQLLLNIGVNAAQAAGSAPGGEVTLALRRVEGDFNVSITDNGPGFTAEARDELGTPFFSTREGGTGLGLATSLRIARDHDGDIVVDPTHRGGARVVVRLPAAEERT